MVPGDPPSSMFRPSERFVIAMRDSENKLRLMVWELNSSSNLNLLANKATDGTVKRVDITRVSKNRVVTAVRDSGNKLRLIVWDISGNGRTITRRGTKVGGSIEDVEIGGEGAFTQNSPFNNRVFTASINNNNKLTVAEWKVTSDGNLRAPPTKIYGTAKQIDISSAEGPDYIISTLVKDADNKLRLISFTESNPQIHRRGGMGTGGEIMAGKTAGIAFAGDVYTVTLSNDGPIGVRTGPHGNHRRLVAGGLLKVIRWRYERVGGSAPIDNHPTREAEHQIGPSDGIARTVDISNLFFNLQNVDAEIVTAHNGYGTFKKLLTKDQGKPRLHIITWNEDLKKTAQTTLGGNYSNIEIVPVRPFADSSRFVTVVRGTETGELKISAWAVRP